MSLKNNTEHDEKSHHHTVYQYVRNMRQLYMNLVIYGSVFLVSVIVWLSLGMGTFWPIWVLFAFVMAAIAQGASLAQLPPLEEFLPFLKKEWEAEQIKKLSPSNEPAISGFESETKE
ncbi:MAG: 2TM domain-containing protein [Alphaproteobacteria bacterium]|nr:2TM domain-containing protein [Alphaproteobacteria bacterium]